MKNYIALLAIVSGLVFSENNELNQILVENADNINLSEESQQEVDSLAVEKDSLLAEWKVVVKQVEGLKIYNEQKRRQIKAQEERLVTLEEQTRQVVVIQRQIPPLMQRMADSLEQFVNLDAPFSLNERLKVFQRIHDMRKTIKIRPDGDLIMYNVDWFNILCGLEKCDAIFEMEVENRLKKLGLVINEKEIIKILIEILQDEEEAESAWQSS